MLDNLDKLTQYLAARPRRALSLPGFREAAVLVPLLREDAQVPRLLFTVRPADMPTHPGQISFPGGKREPADKSLEHTALREAEEELGLFGGVRVLGLLDDVPTPAGFVITPVLGILTGPVALRPSAREVAEVFSAPIDELQKVHRSAGELLPTSRRPGD